MTLIGRYNVRFANWLKFTLIFLLILGVGFRFVNLNHKVYWHDEVYTSFRAAGYTRQEIDQTLFQNQVLPAKALQSFQQIKPGSRIEDTVRSLTLEDPQHPPLYFIMTRLWMQGLDGFLSQVFHSSLTTARSLPALLSLLALPLMYALAWEMFASPAVSLMAATLLALSPYDVLFAQTARQYSLMMAAVIASQWLFLRALRITAGMRQQSRWSMDQVRRGAGAQAQRTVWFAWGWYALALAIGLYTHPLFGLTIVAHLVYLLPATLLMRSPGIAPAKIWLSFGGAVVAALILYAPWIYVMFTNSQRAMATTDWARVFPGWEYLLKLWTLSFTSLFFDLDFGFNNPLTFAPRVLLLIALVAALLKLYEDCQRSPNLLAKNAPLPVKSQTAWLFLLLSILVPFLLLAIPDVVQGGKRSAVSRYLVPCFPAIQLAIAYWLTTHLVVKFRFQPSRSQTVVGFRAYLPNLGSLRRWFWNGVFALFVVGSLASLTVSAASFTWWNKDLSYFNAAVADRINATPGAIVISDEGDDYTNTGDLVSLSYLLKPEVPLVLLSKDASWVGTDTFKAQIQGATAIVFRPSGVLRSALERNYGSLQLLFPEGRLWIVRQNDGG